MVRPRAKAANDKAANDNRPSICSSACCIGFKVDSNYFFVLDRELDDFDFDEEMRLFGDLLPDFRAVERDVVDLLAPERDFVERLLVDFDEVRLALFDFEAPLLAFVDLVVDRLDVDFLPIDLDLDVPLFAFVDLAVDLLEVDLREELDLDVPLFAFVDLEVVLPEEDFLPEEFDFDVPLFALVDRLLVLPPLFVDALARDLVDVLAVFEELDFFAVDFVAISVAPLVTVRAPKILMATPFGTRMIEATWLQIQS